MTLLDHPHHDGSSLYVDDEAPRLGATVTVRMRSHVDDPIAGAWLRTTYDAEPVYYPMTSTTDEQATWWTCDLLMHNPVTHYAC